MRLPLVCLLYVMFQGGHCRLDKDDVVFKTSLDLLQSCKDEESTAQAVAQLTFTFQRLKEEVESLRVQLLANSSSVRVASRSKLTRNQYSSNINTRQWSDFFFGSTATTTTTTTTTTTRRPKSTRVPEVKTLSEKEQEMQYAASLGWDVSIASLCAEGINPNAADTSNNAYTALHLAVLSRQLPAAMTLVRCAANINAADASGNTPLQIAVGREDHWMAGLLLLAKANPLINNRLGRTAYQMALEARDSNFAGMFNTTRLAWFFGSRSLTDLDRTAREYIRNGYYIELVKMCIEGRLNPNIGDQDNNRNTAMHAAAVATINHPMLIQTLVRCGGNVNVANTQGITPLHMAVASTNGAAVAALLLHGADPFISNIQGQTAYLLGQQSTNSYINALFTYPRFEWYLNNMLP